MYNTLRRRRQATPTSTACAPRQGCPSWPAKGSGAQPARYDPELQRRAGHPRRATMGAANTRAVDDHGRADRDHGWPVMTVVRTPEAGRAVAGARCSPQSTVQPMPEATELDGCCAHLGLGTPGATASRIDSTRRPFLTVGLPSHPTSTPFQRLHYRAVRRPQYFVHLAALDAE